MIIIHGDNTIQSYKALSRFENAISLDASQVTLARIRQESEPQDLFGNTQLLIINNLLGGTKSKAKESVIEFLSKHQDLNVLLYETKNLPVTTLKKFTKSTVESYKIENNLFKFLDKLRPHNQKEILEWYLKLLSDKTEVEYLFAMTLRQVRLLIQAKFDPKTLSIPPYPAKLVLSQSKLFQDKKLLDLHHQLYEIDRGIKSGVLPGGLDLHLEHFLLTI